jgi:6-phosphogluconolactonase
VKLSTILLLLTHTTSMSAASQLLVIGTYTPKDGPSRGIYTVRLDTDTGALSAPVLAAETPNPTFLALHANGEVVYAVTESGLVDGKPGGSVAAYRLDRAAGKLTALNVQSTGGASACHVTPDATGRMVVTVAYSGRQIVAQSLGTDGRVGATRSSITSAGPLGPNSARQDQAHPHSTTFSPDNRFAYVCDLGRDKILCFRTDPAAATLTPAGEFASAPGAGPRHSKFSPDGRFFYVLNELNGTIATYACDPATGALTPKQVVATLPEGFTGLNTCAEIRLHPSGRFVYASNRGHDSIAVFARNPAAGTLTRIEIVPSSGGHPRNFALSPDGAWLVCANRDSSNLVVFKVDPATGRLTATGHTAIVPLAVCVVFSGPVQP